MTEGFTNTKILEFAGIERLRPVELPLKILPIATVPVNVGLSATEEPANKVKLFVGFGPLEIQTLPVRVKVDVKSERDSVFVK